MDPKILKQSIYFFRKAAKALPKSIYYPSPDNSNNYTNSVNVCTSGLLHAVGGEARVGGVVERLVEITLPADSSWSVETSKSISMDQPTHSLTD
jgi:hypothetical protein